MRAISVSPPDLDHSYLLAVEQVDAPIVGDHDVLIDVAFAAINRADIYQAQGLYNPPEDADSRLGLEVSGTIIAIGKEVRSHAVGDPVCAVVNGGGYADQVTTAEWRALPVPNGLSMQQAACLPEASFTVYRALMELAQLTPGDRLLVHGGTSSIGLMAIQLAKQFGVTVATTAGTNEKCELAKKYGADLVINYKESDFKDIIKRELGSVDVVLDMVGGEYATQHMSLLSYQGRMVQIATIKGAKAEVNMGALLAKNILWQGFTLRSQPEKMMYEIGQSVRNIIWPLVESGDIEMPIDSVYLPENAADAHERMLAFGHTGKMLLDFSK